MVTRKLLLGMFGTAMLTVVVLVLYMWFGQSKNIDQYVSYLKYDPLLALPGVDLDQYEHARVILNESRNRIAQIDHYPIEISQEFTERMYPLIWLKTMGSLEAQRRIVITEPAPENIKEYHRLLIMAMDEYAEHISELLMWYRDHAEILTAQSNGFANYSGFTSYNFALRNLEHYYQQMEIQKVREQQRWECYRGKSNCLPLEIPPPDRVSGISQESHNNEINEIAEILTSVRTATGWIPISRYLGARLSVSACQIGLQSREYLLWRQPYDTNASVFKIDPLDDVVVRDVASLATHGSTYYQAHEAMGSAAYELQSLGNVYMCPDIAADMTRIQSLLFVYAENSSSDLLPKKTIADQAMSVRIDALRAASENLDQAEIIDEYTVYQYVHQVWLLLYEFSEKELIAELGEVVVHKLQDRLLTYQLGTFNFDMLMTTVADNNNAIISFSEYGKWNYIGDVLVARSAPQLLLGGSNKSVIPVGVSWNQEPENEDYRNSFVSYKNDLQGIITVQEFTDLLIQSSEVSTALLEKVLNVSP